MESLKVSDIRPAKNNARSEVGDVTELAQSIGSIGLMQRLVVRKNGDGWELVDGHRRFAAVKSLGWDHVPVDVFSLSDKESLEAMLITVLQRTDLSALDEARAYQQLVETHGMSQREMSARIGRSQSHISKRMALLELPEAVIPLVDSGGITMDQAQVVLKLKDHPKRMETAVKRFQAGPSYMTLDRTVQEQLAEVKSIEKKAKLKKSIKDKGLVEIAQSKWNELTLSKKAPLGTGYGKLPVDVKEHEEEPCHRALIEASWNSGAPSLVHVCIDVNRHKKSGKSKLKGTVGGGGSGQGKLTDGEKQRRAAMKRRETLEKVAKDRIGFVRKLLRGKVTKDEAFEAMALAASLGVPEELPDSHALCEALEIEPGKDPVVQGQIAGNDACGYSKWDVALRAHLEAKPDTKFKLVFATALHLLEGAARYAINSDWEPRDWLDVTGYLALLEKKGYTITELEIEEIRRADAKRNEALAAAAAATPKKVTKKGAA